jgi:hypothetical protein
MFQQRALMNREATRAKKQAEKANAYADFRVNTASTLTFNTTTQKLLALMLLTAVAVDTVVASQYKSLPSTPAEFRLPVSGTLSAKPLNDCTVKTMGLSEGKVCFSGNSRYFLKKTERHNPLELVTSEYNFRLLKKIGIKTPEIEVFTHEDKYYYATKEIPALITGYSFFQTLEKLNKKSVSVDDYMKALAKKIGQKGICKLFVAVSMIDDLHGANYGIASNKLYIFDADRPIFKDKKSFFTLAISNLKKHFLADLNLANMKSIREIYNNLLETSEPKTHEVGIDLSADYYKEILTLFIAACDDVLQAFNVDSKKSSVLINNAFIAAITKRAMLNDDLNGTPSIRKG